MARVRRIDLPVVLHKSFWIWDDHLLTVETFSAERALHDPEDFTLCARVFDCCGICVTTASCFVRSRRLPQDLGQGRMPSDRADYSCSH